MQTVSNVIDVPLGAGKDDLLGVNPYIKSLNHFIKNAQLPTTLAIQGEWGSGKTSLMNQIRYELCSNDEEDKPFYGVWLNTWQYSILKSPDETLISIIQGATNEVLSIINKKYPNKAKENIDKVKNVFKAFAKAGAKAAVGTVGLDSSVIDEVMSGKNDTGIGGASPMEFKNTLSDTIAQCLEEDKKAGKNTKGFLFFIDDLDRIDPPVAVSILEILKNIFEVENCIFILAIDYDVVVKGLVPKFGPLTDQNEREFRSFFDKIIQLPFTMPVSTYRVDTYLENALEGIGFYTKEEYQKQIDDKKISEILASMVEYSTGTNPRSIKRLINTLSLVLIMSSSEDRNKKLNINERLLTFGLLCLQIAYPSIYNLLLFEPNFKEWGDEIATHFRLPKIDENSENEVSMFTLEEFDEAWEQVLYRACLQNTYLKSRAILISRLLNLVASSISDDKDLSEEIEKVLNISSITSVNSSEATQNADNKEKKAHKANPYVVEMQEKALQYLLEQREQKGDEFRFYTRRVDRGGRFANGFWFLGDNWGFHIPLFERAQIEFSCGKDGWQKINIYYKNIWKPNEEDINFHKKLIEKYNAHKESEGYYAIKLESFEEGLKFFATEFRDSCLDLIKKYNFEERYTIKSNDFNKMISKVQRLRKNLKEKIQG